MTDDRAKTDPPAEGGWYWGRFSDIGERMRPLYVVQQVKPTEELVVFESGSLKDFPVSDYDWFGPVVP